MVRLLLHVIDLSDNQDVILIIKTPRYDLDSRFARFSHFCISLQFQCKSTLSGSPEQHHRGFPTPLHTVKPSLFVGVTQHDTKYRREEYPRLWRSSLDGGGKAS